MKVSDQLHAPAALPQGKWKDCTPKYIHFPSAFFAILHTSLTLMSTADSNTLL